MYRTLMTEVEGRLTELPEMWAERLHTCRTAEDVRNLLGSQPAFFGTVNYTVWSDVFVCPDCTGEVVFWEAAVDKEWEGNYCFCFISLTKLEIHTNCGQTKYPSSKSLMKF